MRLGLIEDTLGAILFQSTGVRLYIYFSMVETEGRGPNREGKLSIYLRVPPPSPPLPPSLVNEEDQIENGIEEDQIENGTG